MAQLVIKNIIFSARVSPKKYESLPLTNEQAFRAMIDKVKDLQVEQGWEVHDIFETPSAKGFIMKIRAKDGCDYYCEVSMRK